MIGDQTSVEDRTFSQPVAEDEKLHPRFCQQKFYTGVPVDKNNKTAQTIAQKIKEQGGKIPYSEFMHEALYGDGGYYSRGKVEFGKDFLTSPVASEVFGATIGLGGAMKIWEAMGKPEIFKIIEMGAGNGDLAYALLKWSKALNPEFYKALKYIILERGIDLIPQQKERLSLFNKKVDWVIGSAYELPFSQVEGFFISNELPDAFPVERVTRINGKLKQKFITVENGEWVEVLDEPSKEVSEFIQEHNINIQEGIEEPINIHAASLQKRLDEALSKGAILTIDYGADGEVGQKNIPSIRGYKKLEKDKDVHEIDYLDIYHYIGDVDITSSVNFRTLKQIAAKDGLPTISGKQRELLFMMGVVEICRKMEGAAENIRSWPELLALSKSLARYHGLMANAHSVHFTLNIKGVGADSIVWDNPDNVYQPTIPLIPINVGNPNRIVRLKFNPHSRIFYYYLKCWDSYKYKESFLPGGRFQADDDGNIWLFPWVLGEVKIYDEGGSLMLDLTNDEKIAEILTALGFSK